MTAALQQGSAVDAATHPAVIWTVIGCACLLAIAKVVPPVVDALSTAAERRRAARQRTEDARIKDLSEQVDYLLGRVWYLDQRAARQDIALMAHAAWDQQLITEAIAAGLTVTPPPPLYPPPDP